MGYNSPMMPVKTRYFEVEIPIREKAPASGAEGRNAEAQVRLSPS